jgi:hypothetical protein
LPLTQVGLQEQQQCVTAVDGPGERRRQVAFQSKVLLTSLWEDVDCALH